MPKGGKREGAGRPKAAAPLTSLTIRLSAEEAAYLAHIGRGNKSAGVRELIHRARFSDPAGHAS